MTKLGRNDRCPCGSGKKYKACCLRAHESVEMARLAVDHAAREQHAAALDDWFFDPDLFADAAEMAVDAATTKLGELIDAGRLDAAEALARDFRAEHPDEPAGWYLLGLVHEARGEDSQAADCYRRVVTHIDAYRTRLGRDVAAIFAKMAAALDHR